MINIITSSRYKINRKRIKESLQSFLSEKNILPETVFNVIFVGRNKMKTITQKYKHEKETLPVLSFPISENGLLGEIFICYPLAVLLAAERNKRVEEMIDWLIRHGIENLVK